jgi:putative nucleotidyltransferase with HDIG domain
MRLKEKKLKKMFIVPDEEEKYRGYIETNLAMAFDDNSGKSIENRAAIISGHSQANAEAVMESPDDPKAYQETKEGVSKYVDFLATKSQGLQSVLRIANVDQDLAHHGITVATLAVGLALELGIEDKKQTELLTLGSLLHDIGHTLHDVKINRPLSEFTPEELELYKSHPALGADMVKNKKHFDEAVIKIIMEHEEMIDGSGFPQGLFSKGGISEKIDKLALICGVANAYDRIITYEGCDVKDGVKRLTVDKMGRYPLEYITALKKVLKDSNML